MTITAVSYYHNNINNLKHSLGLLPISPDPLTLVLVLILAGPVDEHLLVLALTLGTAHHVPVRGHHACTSSLMLGTWFTTASLLTLLTSSWLLLVTTLLLSVPKYIYRCKLGLGKSLLRGNLVIQSDVWPFFFV